MPNATIRCKLTGDVGPGLDAHIIPRAFYNLRDESGDFQPGGTVFTLEGSDFRESRRPIGVYDSTMVTTDGESHFSDCDRYAAQFFLQDFGHKPWASSAHGSILSLGAEHFDSYLLRRFCMTVLWRAHATTQPFFDNVDLGPHEPRLRALILDEDVGDPSDFSIILSGWTNIEHGRWPITAPGRFKTWGINFYRFKTAGVVFTIKVDSRPFPARGLEVVVGGGPDLQILQRDFNVPASHRRLFDEISARYDIRSTGE